MPAHRPKLPSTSRDPATHRDLRSHKTLSNRRRKHIDKYFTPLPITAELIAHRLTPAPHECPDYFPTTPYDTYKELRRGSWFNRRGYACRCTFCFMDNKLPRPAKMNRFVREIAENVESEEWQDDWYVRELDYDVAQHTESLNTHWDWISVLSADGERHHAMEAEWKGRLPIGSEKFEGMMDDRFGFDWMQKVDPTTWAFQVRGREHVLADAVERAMLIAGLEVEVGKRPWMRPENWPGVEKYLADERDQSRWNRKELSLVRYPNWTLRDCEERDVYPGYLVYAVARELWRARNEDVTTVQIEEEVDEDGEKEWDVVSISSSIADGDDLIIVGQGGESKQCIVM